MTTRQLRVVEANFLEGRVESAVRDCEIVELPVVPTFDFTNSLQPLDSLFFQAVSETAGVIASEQIRNTDENGQRTR